MPAKQRGVVDKCERSWRARWYDEQGQRRSKKGFRTKSEARDWVDNEVDKVEKLRLGINPAFDGELPTVQQLVDEFLSVHVAEQNTIATLTYRLKHVTAKFGDVRIDRIVMPEVMAWRKQLPAKSAWHIHKAFRQVLNYAVAARYITHNVARDVPNPEPKRSEVPWFETPADVDRVDAQLELRYRGIAVFASETGLRPEEWIALERRDLEIDKDAGVGVVHIRRVYTDGQLKQHGKQEDSLRTVGLTRRAVAAINARPVRIDTPLLFPEEDGSYVDLGNFRRKHWDPAVELAGLHIDEFGRKIRRTPYSLRHTYAAWLIAARIDTYTIAKRMGTSTDQIDKTYGHLMKRSLDAERDALEAWQASLTKGKDAKSK